ncbi:hypothetical protein AGMMS49928_03670 [Spirochaetia bacterium]|nr:hypothetical protein AGMMS49928_03670 [Spirochaetia bacterium]
MDAFEQAVAGGLGDWPRGTVFLAAVSGGADSTAMLAALASLRREKGFPHNSLHCLHVDHGIRPREECRGDAEAVRALCKSLHVPLRIVSIKPGKVAETGRLRGIGLEGAARLFRRRIWNREARRIGAKKILVAHTLDDLLETALMRILRGGGPAGVAGMARVRGGIQRPLLCLRRAEVLRYLEEKKISYRTDSTNADIRYLRNRIRHKLIPCLEEFFPRWRKSLLLFLQTQKLTAEFLEDEARKALIWDAPGQGILCADKDAFFALPAILREEAFLLGADRLISKKGKKPEVSGFSGLSPDLPKRKETAPRRAAFRQLLEKKESGDLGPLRFEVKGQAVNISLPGGRGAGDGFSLLIKEPGIYKLEELIVEAVSGVSAQGKAAFYARLPLVLRPWHKDDRINRRAATPAAQGAEQVLTAEDSAGLAAFISRKKRGVEILLRREGEQDAPEIFLITISGVTDA